MICKLSVLMCVLLMFCSSAFALGPNHQYTVSVDGINSDGTIADLGISTEAVTNAAGVLSFSFSNTIPSRNSYNFLLVSIEDAGVAVRRAVVPAPASGSTTNLGVSPMTESQTSALLEAMQSNSTDNPMLVLFGSLLIRSGAFDDETLTLLASMIGNAIAGTDGFSDFLVEKVGAEKTDAFYSAIVDHFGDYTRQLKHAVEESSALDAKNYRAAAASLLSAILIQSADEADFNYSYVIAAMKASSDKIEKFIGDGGEGELLDESVINALDMIMIVNDLKLQAEMVKQKYVASMSVLDATDEQMTKVGNAVNNLTEALTSAFQDMEEIFEDEEQFDSTVDDIDMKLDDVQGAIESAFSAFMIDIAAEDAEITAMRAALGVPAGVPAEAFKFTTMNGDNVNWPVTTVTVLTWLSSNYPGFTYARAATAVPAAMSWMPERTDFTAAPFDTMQVLLQNVFGLREDIEILDTQKYLGEICASYDIVMAPGDRAAFLADEGDDFLIAADEGGQVEWFGTDAEEDNDAADDPDITAGFTWMGYDAGASGSKSAFSHLNDLSPFLTGYELQVIEEWSVNQETVMKGNVSNAVGITASQLQAVFDALKTPQID